MINLAVGAQRVLSLSLSLTFLGLMYSQGGCSMMGKLSQGPIMCSGRKQEDDEGSKHKQDVDQDRCHDGEKNKHTKHINMNITMRRNMEVLVCQRYTIGPFAIKKEKMKAGLAGAIYKKPIHIQATLFTYHPREHHASLTCCPTVLSFLASFPDTLWCPVLSVH